MAGIFQKERLRPSQARTVADRRLGDAECLRKSGQNARANGAMYLGGIAIECLLKAKLMEKHRWLQGSVNLAHRSPEEQDLWRLCYREHDLEGILEQLPEVRPRLQNAYPDGRLAEMLASLAAEWTIYARYSPRTATMSEAVVFLGKVKEVKEWLK